METGMDATIMSFRHPYNDEVVHLETTFFCQDPSQLHNLWDHEEIKTLEKYHDCFYVLWPECHHNYNFRENMKNVEKAIGYYYDQIHKRWLLDFTPEEETEVMNKFGYIIGLKQAIREGYALDKHEYWENRPQEEQEELDQFMTNIRFELEEAQQKHLKQQADEKSSLESI